MTRLCSQFVLFFPKIMYADNSLSPFFYVKINGNDFIKCIFLDFILTFLDADSDEQMKRDI
jgi:hypothetical protein